MRIRDVLQMSPDEIVKDKEKLKVLFDFYKARLTNSTWIINTSPHDINFGREVIKGAVSQIYTIFAAEVYYKEAGNEGGIRFMQLDDYVPIYAEYRDNIIGALEDLDIYAVGSVITVDAFKSKRVVGLFRKIGGKKRNGASLGTFVIPRGIKI